MKKMNTSDGTISAKPPANRKGNGELFRAVKTWAGRVRFEIVRTLAANTSFQDSTNVNRLEAARPGSANGSATRVNAPIGVQPRVRAASSTSRGMAMKMLLVIRTVVG